MYSEWFDRTVGKWSSNRRYIYLKNNKIENIDTVFIIRKNDDGMYTLGWNSAIQNKEVSEGLMHVAIVGDRLMRSCGYMTEKETVCHIKMIDQNTILLETEYDGMQFREEIRLLDDDTRLRQTVGMKNGKRFLVGQYYETRIE